MSTKMVSLRIDTELLEYLTERSKSEHRSLSNLIVSVLLDAKEKDNRKKPEGYICGDTGEVCTDCAENCIYKHSL